MRLRARREPGDTIDEMTKLVSEGEMLAAREARQQADLERQWAMLKALAQAAAR